MGRQEEKRGRGEKGEEKKIRGKSKDVEKRKNCRVSTFYDFFPVGESRLY